MTEQLDQPYKAFNWCIENNIKIYCLPKKPSEKLYAVQVNNNGKITTSDKKYQKNQVDNKIWELYLFIYLKYNE